MMSKCFDIKGVASKSAAVAVVDAISDAVVASGGYVKRIGNEAGGSSNKTTVVIHDIPTKAYASKPSGIARLHDQILGLESFALSSDSCDILDVAREIIDEVQGVEQMPRYVRANLQVTWVDG